MVTQNKHYRILIVDDDIDVTEVLKTYFSESGYTVDAVAGLAAAQEVVGRSVPALVIAGTVLEDAEGIKLLQYMRARPRTAHIPVMFVAPIDESDRRNEILSAGADDFMVKPFDVDIVGLRVRNAIARTERDGLTHPRSGLPTGRLLDERAHNLSGDDGLVLLEITIADYEGFRESYDFITANEVLSFTAKLLCEVSNQAGTDDDFIGHRTAESFVVITRQEVAPDFAEMLCSRFNNGAQAFYNFMDRERGFIELDDGAGGIKEVPLMALEVKITQTAVG
jgi:DNA-binding response OmpR family regulator